MAEPQCSRVGAWFIGSFGSLATTTIVGARAIAQGICPPIGLVSESDEFQQLGLPPLSGLVFGGHEIRSGSLEASAHEISRENGSIPSSWIERLRDELREISRRVRPGTAAGGGAAVQALADLDPVAPERGRDCVDRLIADLRRFREKEQLDEVVVVNVASTEPPLEPDPACASLNALEQRLDRAGAPPLRPGLLYAYAAFAAGAAFINFAASDSCLCPSIEEFAARCARPYMGNDGKTGETLVKSALAPLFRVRQLQVLSWVGYNVLGNRDGRVLATEANKRSKVASKDAVVSSILGYPLRTHVGIDFVESLGDNKVAWDFIHFRGFLGHPMSMQFTWQGCDSILAAPLVLDLVRFAAAASARREAGPMGHLSSFFKNPLHGTEHDLFQQYEVLRAYSRSRPPRD